MESVVFGTCRQTAQDSIVKKRVHELGMQTFWTEEVGHD